MQDKFYLLTPKGSIKESKSALPFQARVFKEEPTLQDIEDYCDDYGLDSDMVETVVLGSKVD